MKLDGAGAWWKATSGTLLSVCPPPQVCDEPHPLLVKEMLGHCVSANIDEAYKVSAGAASGSGGSRFCFGFQPANACGRGACLACLLQPLLCATPTTDVLQMHTLGKNKEQVPELPCLLSGPSCVSGGGDRGLMRTPQHL